MRKVCNLLLLAFLLFISAEVAAGDRDYYQMTIYWIENEDQEAMLDSYLRDAYLPALHRAGIDKVGVFKPIEGKNEGKKFVMTFIPLGSFQDFEELPLWLKKDNIYQESGSKYILAAHDQPYYKRTETILMRAFSATPKLGTPVSEGIKRNRVYELRSYEAATEFLYERKVEMFNEGESDLFIKLGFNPLFFAEVLSSSYMPHLMYMTTFEDEKSQEACWDAFREHPDWLGMKDLERYRNTVSTINRYLLYPADYSDL
jgi:hypothetical protein